MGEGNSAQDYLIVLNYLIEVYYLIVLNYLMELEVIS